MYMHEQACIVSGFPKIRDAIFGVARIIVYKGNLIFLQTLCQGDERMS